MKKTGLFYIFLILVITFSCNNNESKIKNAESIVNDIKQNIDKYRQQDWDKADTLFTSLESDLDKNSDKYTPEQIENANKIIGSYKAIKIQKEINGLKKTVEGFGQQIKGAIEVFSDTTKSE
jgi:hypothetical protein